MPVDQIFLEKVITVVKNNFGDYTAKLYSDSFKAKSKEEIVDFMNKLLTEFIGPDMASKQMSRIIDN